MKSTAVDQKGDLRVYEITFGELGLDVGSIETSMGYGRGESFEPIPETIARHLAEAEPLASLKGGVRILRDASMSVGQESLSVDGKVFGIGKVICGQVRRCESVALFVCTAGAALEDRSKALSRDGDLLGGFVVDSIGSAAVEAAMDRIQEDLAQELSQAGLSIGNRFSPGYCGWPVSEQQTLFGFFPEDFCGVTLTPSSLMVPMKSISGFVGIGHGLKRTDYPCALCDMQSCFRRGKRPLG